MNQTQICFLREHQVAEITGLSKTTRRRLELDGKFPKRRKLSTGAVGWLRNEINQWIESRLII